MQSRLTYLRQFTAWQPTSLMPYQMASFATMQKQLFGSDTPAKSGKYHKGLYHGKTHGQRYQRCFSMKYSLVTMKPNVMRKTYSSKILQQTFKIFVSMKARRCIIKKGSLDNYLLQTKPAEIDSKFGLYLRDLMIKKKEN